MKFSEKLIKLRKDAALSKEDLALKLNVTKETISNWEEEKSKPSTEQLLELGKIFNRSTEELLNDEELKQRKSAQKGTNSFLLIFFIVFIIIIILVMIYQFVIMRMLFKNTKKLIKKGAEYTTTQTEIQNSEEVDEIFNSAYKMREQLLNK